MLRTVIIIAAFLTSAFANNGSESFCDNPDSKVLHCYCGTIEIRCRGGSNSSYDEAWKLFETVPDIKYLTFLSNFNYLPTQMLAALPNLQNYRCLLTNITIVPKYSFNNLYKLEVIDLAYNKLTTIEGLAFNNLPNLERILLFSNKIKTIDETAFIALPKLITLVLSNNSLEKIPDLVESFKSLNDFVIANNSLVCDCKLHWVANLFEKSQSEFTKRYAMETNCTLSDGSWIKLVNYDFMKICGIEDWKTTIIAPTTTTIELSTTTIAPRTTIIAPTISTIAPTTTAVPIISPKTLTIKSMNTTILLDILKQIPEAKILLNVKEIIFHNPVINFNYNYNNGTTERASPATHD